MTYAKNSTITAIRRPITNGMYDDTYTVIYSNGIRRNYTIKGAMNKKHFEFIQSATVESRYSKHTGKHTADIFTAPAEPKEEPTTEEQTAEEPTTTDTPADNNEEVNNMRTYTAYVTDKNSKQSYFITADDYSNKKAFAEDLRRNGYAVHYIATPYTIDAVSDSYNKRREYRNEVARNIRAAVKAHSEAVEEEPTSEEPAADQEPETIKPFDELTEEELDAIIAEEVEKEYFGGPAADQEPETSENYIAWCGMIENDVITDEFETLSEAVDEVETQYTKEEQKALGITYCRLLCNAGQWLECLDEKTVDDVYYF